MRSLRQLTVGMLAIGAVALGGAVGGSSPAGARVSVGIGIGIPGPGYYTVRTGRCANPRFAYYHPDLCGYPTYSEPVFIDGAWVTEPIHYRIYGGRRYFWWHGGWHLGHGTWDGHHFNRNRVGYWRDRNRNSHWRGPNSHDRNHDRDWRDRDHDRARNH